MFKQNESELDKKIRIGIALISLLLAIFVFTGTLQLIALLVAIIATITGYTGFCPLYKIFGISTKK